MAIPSPLAPIDDMPRTPASAVKKTGWRGVMRSLQDSGQVVVTNHNEPQAIILSIETYNAIRRAMVSADDGVESALDQLRRQFDERMAVLDEPDASERLRELFGAPIALNGEVKAGEQY